MHHLAEHGVFAVQEVALRCGNEELGDGSSVG